GTRRNLDLGAARSAHQADHPVQYRELLDAASHPFRSYARGKFHPRRTRVQARCRQARRGRVAGLRTPAIGNTRQGADRADPQKTLVGRDRMAGPPMRYGAAITLELAKRVMAAAEAEAKRNQWPMVIAIVDTAGLLVMLHRVEQAQNASVLLSQEKARTAVDFKRSTKALQDAIAQGGANLR